MARKLQYKMIQEEKKMNYLRELKQFNQDAVTDVEELISLEVQATALRQGFQHRNITVPEWLDDVTRRIGRAIDTQTADQRELLKKQIKAELSNLETQSQKRARLEATLASLGG